MDRSRRRFLVMAGLVPAAALATSAGLAAEASCYDPSALPLSQKSRRRSIGFVKQSADPAKRCGLCAFFRAGAGDCGTCDLLGGGVVVARSMCTSFAAKAP